MEKERKLSAKEKIFCALYAEGGSTSESASIAGYGDPLRDGLKLLMREGIRREIERQYHQKDRINREMARAGYKRLAFGNTGDAVRLLFSDGTLTGDPAEYDLFCVSEIRRPREGAIEIRFFDRLKALEKLEGAGNETDTDTVPAFYRALIGGIRDYDMRESLSEKSLQAEGENDYMSGGDEDEI